MIVAAGTIDAQRHERAGGGGQLLVREVQFLLHRVVFANHLGAKHQEAGCDQSLGAVGVTPVREDVASQLLAHELVIGLVLIERPDHVVAVAPGVAVHDVVVHPVAIRIARHVQPMPAPALPVARRGQQPVHNPREGIVRRIGEERSDLVRGGKQAVQVERSPPNQRSLVAGSCGAQAGSRLADS